MQATPSKYKWTVAMLVGIPFAINEWSTLLFALNHNQTEPKIKGEGH